MSPGSVRRGNLVLGAVLVVLGALFLVAAVLGADVWRVAWPFLVIVPGALFFLLMVVAGRDAGALAIPGSMITITGFILLYQSLTHHYASWAYVWALVSPTGVGVGLLIWGVRSGRESITRAGWIVAKVGFALFVVFGLFFELILNIGGGGLERIFWPILVILFGVYLLIQPERWRGRPAEQPAPGQPLSFQPRVPQAPPAPPKQPDEPA
jgi:hypothetical protein